MIAKKVRKKIEKIYDFLLEENFDKLYELLDEKMKSIRSKKQYASYMQERHQSLGVPSRQRKLISAEIGKLYWELNFRVYRTIDVAFETQIKASDGSHYSGIVIIGIAPIKKDNLLYEVSYVPSESFFRKRRKFVDHKIVFLDKNGDKIGHRIGKTKNYFNKTYGYFLDWIYQQLTDIVEIRTIKEKEIIIQTTLDRTLQEIAQNQILQKLLESGEKYKVDRAALLSMEKDGAIRTMVGGKDYSAYTYNFATLARRRAGATFMPYVFLTALENGLTPDSILVDSPVKCKNFTIKNYSPKHYGAITLKKALSKSIHTIAVKLSLDSNLGGRKKIIENAKKLGIDGLRKTCTLAIGDQHISLLENTTGYAVFCK